MDAMETMHMQEKTCLYCQARLRGRSDKKFCNDDCRNLYHNRMPDASKMLIRRINQVLAMNRRILQALFTEQGYLMRVHRKQLSEQGFQFEYITREECPSAGTRYRYCYEFGMMELPDEWFLLFRKD